LNLLLQQSNILRIRVHSLPLIDGLDEFVKEQGEQRNKQCEPVWNLITKRLKLGLEPETSGGLLVVLPCENVVGFVEELREIKGMNHKCFEIGVIEESENNIREVLIENAKIV